MTARKRAEGAEASGFALLIVLWTLLLLSLVVTHVIASGSAEARIAANLRANAAAEALADGAVFEAIFRMVDSSGTPWTADGTSHKLGYRDAAVSVRILPLAGKVNPNFASLPLLSALLAAGGADEGEADAVARAIADWRGRDNRESPLAQRQGPYRTAGFEVGPPGGPIESLDELGHVLGMTPALLQAVKPYLSLYQMGPPDPALAAPVVAQALRHLPQSLPSPSAEAEDTPPAKVETVSVEAVVTAADGARFTRRAVIRVGPVFPRGYIVLAWGGAQDED
jgi:general secretion pathway protein K